MKYLNEKIPFPNCVYLKYKTRQTSLGAKQNSCSALALAINIP